MTAITERALKLPVGLQDLGKPSLHALSYALRHPDTWPVGFIWDFSECATCAMGLAHQLWKQIPETNPDNAASIMARQFGMPFTEAKNIFLGDGDWMPYSAVGHLWWKQFLSDHSAVTPDMVADAIDEYLATAE